MCGKTVQGLISKHLKPSERQDKCSPGERKNSCSKEVKTLAGRHEYTGINFPLTFVEYF